MTPSSRRALPILAVWACVFAPPAPLRAREFAYFHENVMGTSLELRVEADTADAAGRAETCALREIDRLSKVFSGYDPDSEFQRWQRTPKGPVRVSAELFEVLQACDHWRTATGGAFDPRVEVLSRLWAACARLDRTPTNPEISDALERMRPDPWRLDLAARTAERLTDCPLSLDAIAKGYIVGRACAAAFRPGDGIGGLLLNVGGDLRVCGGMTRTIGVSDPRRDSESSEPLTTIRVRDRSVSTSGRSQRGFRIGGLWYSHILDPRTGRPVERTAGATVVARSAVDADALATAFNVLSPDESIRLADALPGTDCLIVAADGRVRHGGDWRRIESVKPGPLALAAAAAAAVAPPEGPRPWGDEFEVVVDFEINRPEAEKGRYRRPYVAVWVEDKDGFPVRNLTLWVSLGGSGPFQWLPDLKRWYKGDQTRKRTDKTEMVLTVARPTRPPGKYSVIWDGTDDHGKPLARGDYTLCIDAAREHGTYQGLRTPLKIAGEPFSDALQGGVEIKAASVTYRKKMPAQ